MACSSVASSSAGSSAAEVSASLGGGVSKVARGSEQPAMSRAAAAIGTRRVFLMPRQARPSRHQSRARRPLRNY
ncbi:hypothetical protein FM103_00015 [Corynebacterium xerosis]|nr:hypothetical protein FM103_00015 [Corynebacterium xerosis]